MTDSTTSMIHKNLYILNYVNAKIKIAKNNV